MERRGIFPLVDPDRAVHRQCRRVASLFRCVGAVMSDLTIPPDLVIEPAAAERAIARCEALLQAHYARLAARKREPFHLSPATPDPGRNPPPCACGRGRRILYSRSYLMKFEIKNRWSGNVQFACELSAEIADKSYGLRLGFAVREAIKTRADLTDAVLTDADLTGADLTGADLTDAVLTDAVLTGADLTGADLTDAVLTGADLTGAVLTDADLTGADLTGADLTDAVLTGADLTGAVLTGADLTGADLTGAVLTGADMTGAD